MRLSRKLFDLLFVLGPLIEVLDVLCCVLLCLLQSLLFTLCIFEHLLRQAIAQICESPGPLAFALHLLRGCSGIPQLGLTCFDLFTKPFHFRL